MQTTLQDQHLVIFVCSTTGQGEVPDNMKVRLPEPFELKFLADPSSQTFWRRLLARTLPNHLLSKMKCAVFGLGDSGYVRFNFAAKMLYNRLGQLGATHLTRRGDGDDQHRFGYFIILLKLLN